MTPLPSRGTKKVLICGSRDWSGLDDQLRARIDALDPDTVVIHGGAPGVDFWSGFWAEQRGMAVQEFRADWKRHGKAAGPIRLALHIDEDSFLGVARGIFIATPLALLLLLVLALTWPFAALHRWLLGQMA